MYKFFWNKIRESTITYLHACHTRFNYKFNGTKAMDVAHVDELLHGQVVIELYHEQL